jgi:uncharacterized protein (TIGR00369 family)
MFEALRKALPRLDLEGKRNVIRDVWDALSPLPGGRVVFSSLVSRMAAYTGTISPRVISLRPGYAQVEMEDRPRLRNHVGSLHAIALANVAELAGNLALAYSLPDDARFIVSGVSIDYVKKARGTITAIGTCVAPENAERAEVVIEATLLDASGDTVAVAHLRSIVGPKPWAKSVIETN